MSPLSLEDVERFMNAATPTQEPIIEDRPWSVGRDLADANPDGKAKGKIAYERYRAKQGGKAFNGQPIPSWEDVRSDIQAAWEDVAETLYEWGYAVGTEDQREADDESI